MSDALQELFSSLDQRWRPERVAEVVIGLLSLSGGDAQKVKRAAAANRRSWMPEDFSRPATMEHQLSVAGELFDAEPPDSPEDGSAILDFIVTAGREINWDADGTDFMFNRLPKHDRYAVGLTISRRQYNKRFRLLGRMVAKLTKMQREQLKRSIVLASKSRLGSSLTREEFSSDVNTACFIAYFVARSNMRSIFTNAKQVRAFDDICDVLFKRCGQSQTTNWFAIAHVHPTGAVLGHLTDEQRGVLLGRYYGVMQDCVGLLEEVWTAGDPLDAVEMVVKRGNDSTTWNVTAGAWNKIREGWLSLLHSLKLEALLDDVCPGKVMRLMAADVAYWHRMSGGAVHPDTLVWAELPRPWEVLSGEAHCDRKMVEEACGRHGINPKKSGWLEYDPPKGPLAKFEPTPDLVHGIAISNPDLALSLRKMGVFSGGRVKAEGPEVVADLIAGLADRDQHVAAQEARPAGADRS